MQSPDRDDTLGPPGDGEPVQGSDTVQHNQVTMHSHFIVTTLRTLYAALQYWSFLSYCTVCQFVQSFLYQLGHHSQDLRVHHIFDQWSKK